MINIKNSAFAEHTHRVKALQDKLHYCDGVWRCYYLEEIFIGMVQQNSAQLRLSSTLYPVQLRIRG